MVRGPRTSRRRLGRGQLRLLCSPPPLRIGSGATVLLCLVTSVVAAAASLPAALAHGAVGGWTHGYHTAGHTAHGRHLDALAAHVAHGDGDGGGHFACGVGTPFADAHTLGGDDAAVTSKAQYHTLDHGDVTRRLAYLGRDRDLSDAVAGLGRQRRAQDAEYATRNSDGSTFLPLSLADDLGLSAGIRIEVLWEVVEGGDFSGPKAGSNARQCTAENAPITVPCELDPSPSCTQVWSGCSPADIVGPDGSVGHPDGVSKLQAMKTRVGWAVDFFHRALRVKPLLSDIELSSGVVDEYNLDTTSVPDADLVIIMTARPSPWVALNGFAACVQRDQFGRCLVGVFNWVPNVLTLVDGAPAAGSDTVTAERHTALHEIIHVLGGMNPNPTFIDEGGNGRTSGVYIRDEDSAEHYQKPVPKIVTQRVLAMARAHYGCPDMRGMPLEDQPTGRAAHWEARLMGPEVMSYGTGTGETYLSDLTFALLEDTNQYRANYSLAGPLVDLTGDTAERETPFRRDVVPGPDYVPPVDHSPGALRWGRQEGCDFVEQSVAAWPDRYRCSTAQEFACSFENRMSSVCIIQPGWSLPSDGSFTCGDCPEGRRTCDFPSCTLLNDRCDGTGCRLPSMFQYFTAATVTAAVGAGQDPERTGGFSSAMDYAPVRLSYWNCQQANISTGSALLAAESGSGAASLDAAGGVEDDVKLFGGQAYCPECRCFVSSLMDLTSGSVNPNFPRFGLCYRSNCYRQDYLQFAIENQLGDGATWYKCPAEGGKIYIAGFSGAFHCPPAREFCQFEEITGIKYKETNPLWEWIFYAGVTGLPTLVVLMCVLIPCYRRWAVHRGKKWCGVNHFNRRGDVDHDGEIDDDEVAQKPPKVPSTVLLGTNLSVLLVALFLFAVAVFAVVNGRVSNAGPLILTVSSTAVTFAVMGAYGAVKESRGISCVIVAYFYVTFGSFLMFIFMCLVVLLFPENFNAFLEKHWDTLVDATPEDFLPRELDGGGGIAVIQASLAAVVTSLVVMLLVFFVNLTMTVWIITTPVLASTMMTIASYAFVFMGVLICAAGGYVTMFHSGLDADINTVVAVFVCFGLYLIAANILALVGAFTKERTILLTSLGCECLTLVFFAAGAGGLFAATSEMDALVEGLDDDQLNSLTRNLGLAGLSRPQVAAALRGNVRTLGLMAVVSIVMLVFQIWSNGYFLHRVKKHIRRLNSQKMHVVPYTHNRKQLGADGQPIFHSAKVRPADFTGSIKRAKGGSRGAGARGGGRNRQRGGGRRVV